jgi:hypothetical protein
MANFTTRVITSVQVLRTFRASSEYLQFLFLCCAKWEYLDADLYHILVLF